MCKLSFITRQTISSNRKVCVNCVCDFSLQGTALVFAPTRGDTLAEFCRLAESAGLCVCRYDNYDSHVWDLHLKVCTVCVDLHVKCRKVEYLVPKPPLLIDLLKYSMQSQQVQEKYALSKNQTIEKWNRVRHLFLCMKALILCPGQGSSGVQLVNWHR